MNILEEIKQQKLVEVETKKSLYPVKLLQQTLFFESACVSMKKYIGDPKRSGIIAEFKRKSPSKGDINKYANVQEVTLGYMQAGAAALSVLTDEKFFGAKKDDLQTARKFNYCPILRKDFIVDEYQIIEAKSMGADVILLIAKMLSPQEIKALASFAKSLGMEVFLEFQNRQEINENISVDIDLAGINNRSLNTFEVDIENSIHLVGLLPKELLKIAESGIDGATSMKLLKQNGFNGFLIGEYFMRHSNPGQKCKELLKQVQDEN
jgi:indole-3-glycerol phosphate synthase